jgi:rubrerythrin
MRKEEFPMRTLEFRALSVRSRQNLTETMKEEAFALVKCKRFAQQARKYGHARMANRLEKIAERHYFKQFARQADLLGLFPTDLPKASQFLAEESLVVDIICKQFAQEAQEDGDTEVARCLNQSRTEELLQRRRLNQALGRSGGHLRGKHSEAESQTKKHSPRRRGDND